ncbi:hypothetical protein C8Q80DRAFT_939796 [Daedaleopsis nitida]|nr:hypothetical protein C8Q80DRAFT_939796 [Daedaleopsis nitida]
MIVIMIVHWPRQERLPESSSSLSFALALPSPESDVPAPGCRSAADKSLHDEYIHSSPTGTSHPAQAGARPRRLASYRYQYIASRNAGTISELDPRPPSASQPNDSCTCHCRGAPDLAVRRSRASQIHTSARAQSRGAATWNLFPGAPRSRSMPAGHPAARKYLAGVRTHSTAVGDSTRTRALGSLWRAAFHGYGYI